MGMGVATMPVIEINRYTKAACRCTCIDQHVSECACLFLETNCENGHAV